MNSRWGSAAWQRRRRAAASSAVLSERIPHVERLELPEAAVVRAEGSHPVPKQDRGGVRVGHEAASNDCAGRHVQAGVQESVLSGHHTRGRQRKEGLDVGERS